MRLFKNPSSQVARRTNSINSNRGFSVVEFVVAMFIIMVLTAIALPSVAAMLRSYRAQGDARSIAAELALARLRASADFTQARLFVNVNANTYRVDVWNSAGAGCWQTDGATAACDAPASAATVVPQDIRFSQGDAPGVGAATAAPPATQAVFGQAPACLNNAGNVIANTICVVFNSRGIPVVPGNPLGGVINAATGDDAIYFASNGGLTYALTVTASGKTSIWTFVSGAWQQR